MATIVDLHQSLTAIAEAISTQRSKSQNGARKLKEASLKGLFELLAPKSLTNGIFSKLSLEQQYQRLKGLPQAKPITEEEDWAIVTQSWLGKRVQPSQSAAQDRHYESGDEEDEESGEEEDDFEGSGIEEGIEENSEAQASDEPNGKKRARKGDNKQIEDAEAELEKQMQEYIDELNEKDEREGLFGEDEDGGLDAALDRGKKGKLSRGRGVVDKIPEDEMEDAEMDEQGLEEEDDEDGENAVIRARPGAKYEKDEMDDEEYEQLLRQEMDEEELDEYNKKKDGGDEEEEDQLGDDMNDEEIENGIFNEMRPKSSAIEEQEQKLLSDKPWQMKGEIRGHERPKDALVSVDVDYQRGVELKPKAPAKVSKDIEKMIEQRILKEAFDDPRPVIVKQDLSWKQNFEELNFEKDTRGLTALYEDEYKKNILGLPVESKEQKLHKEILQLYREISNTLDNLTNSSFVPMPVLDIERKNKKDIETIKLEEKIPITVKSVDGLANAKSVFESTHKNFVVENEKTVLDNQRDRRIAKRKIRSKLKDKRAKELVKSLDYKGQTKYEYNLVNKAKKAVEHEHDNAAQTRNNMTKSSDFFKVLQENSERRKKSEREVLPQSVQASKLKKLKL